jgi:Mg2+ and Co2+ transporter CorA
MAGSIIIPLLAAFNPKGVHDAEKALEGLGSKIKGLGKTAAVGLGSALAGAQAVAFVKNSVQAGAELQQSMSGVKTIFGDMTSEVQKFIATSESMGMTTAEAAKAVTFLGSVFKQTGMPMQNVIDHTKTMVSLAADLSATYGYSVEEALTAMTATFRGEYDPIEKFGVAMKQQQVNAMLASEGLSNLTGSALIAAQQEARYQMILQRTSDAQGAFGRQSGNLAVQMNILHAVWTDMQAQLGMKLVPALASLTTKLQPLIRDLAPHLGSLFEMIGQAIVDLAPLIPMLVKAFVKLYDVLHKLTQISFPVLKFFLNWFISNISGVVTFVVALTALRKVEPIVRGLTGAIKILKYEWEFASLVATEAAVAKGVAKVTTATKMATFAQLQFNTATKANPWLLLATAVAITLGLIVDGISQAQDKVDTFNQKVKRAPQDIQAQAVAAGEAARKQFLATSKLTDQADLLVGAQARATYAQNQFMQNYFDGLKKIDNFNNAWAQRYPNGAMYKALYGTDPKAQGFDVNMTDPTSAVDAWGSSLQSNIDKQTRSIKLGKLGASKGLIQNILGDTNWQGLSDIIIAGGKAKVAYYQKLFNQTADGIAEIQQKAADAANALTKKQQKALDKLAPAKDRLVTRLKDIEQAYVQVAKSIMEYGNITNTTTESITQSYKTMLNGIEVTVSKTVDVITSSGLVDHFKEMLDKTKQFYKDLTELKNKGLDTGIMQQIVSSGVDAGTATAEALLSGGANAINSVNSSFAELKDVSSQIAEFATPFMANGSGLDLASSAVDSLTNNLTVGKRPKGGESASTYVLNITAGMGADGASLGKTIVNYIKQYERNNGAVWVASK